MIAHARLAFYSRLLFSTVLMDNLDREGRRSGPRTSELDMQVRFTDSFFQPFFLAGSFEAQKDILN